MTRPHLIDGEFQSDKYPTTPRGKVPLSVKDLSAQDLLWEYAQRRRVVDADFSADLEAALRLAGYAGNRLLVALPLVDEFAIRALVDHLKAGKCDVPTCPGVDYEDGMLALDRLLARSR